MARPGTFPKGKSGNPGGRPKQNPEVKELAREHTVEAVARLAFWMRSDEPKASVSASAALLDRGWGKPSQDVNVAGNPDFPLKHIVETHIVDHRPADKA